MGSQTIKGKGIPDTGRGRGYQTRGEEETARHIVSKGSSDDKKARRGCQKGKVPEVGGKDCKITVRSLTNPEDTR
jgi:hypothetical protein